MKIRWLGHSCFLITADNGVRIILDPFKSESHLSYPPVKESADIVTISHGHFDHNHTALIPGKFEVIKESGLKSIKDVGIKGVSAWHDDSGGRERGNNIVYCLNVDGIRMCHLGDLGHGLTIEQKREIGEVDVLFVPIGGIFTLDIAAASMVCEDLKPKIAIPMHYKTDRCAFLQYSADDFIKGKKNAKRLDSSEVEIKKESLPSELEILVLQYAR